MDKPILLPGALAKKNLQRPQQPQQQVQRVQQQVQRVQTMPHNPPQEVHHNRVIMTKEDFESFQQEEDMTIGLMFMSNYGSDVPPEIDPDFNIGPEIYKSLFPEMKEAINKGTLTREFATKIKKHLVDNVPVSKIGKDGKVHYIDDNIMGLLNLTSPSLLVNFNIDPLKVIKKGKIQQSDVIWLPYQAAISVLNALIGSNNWMMNYTVSERNIAKNPKENVILEITITMDIWFAMGVHLKRTSNTSSIYGKSITKYNRQDAITALVKQLFRQLLGERYNVFNSLNNEPALLQGTRMALIGQARFTFKEQHIEDANSRIAVYLDQAPKEMLLLPNGDDEIEAVTTEQSVTKHVSQQVKVVDVEEKGPKKPVEIKQVSQKKVAVKVTDEGKGEQVPTAEPVVENVTAKVSEKKMEEVVEVDSKSSDFDFSIFDLS